MSVVFFIYDKMNGDTRTSRTKYTCINIDINNSKDKNKIPMKENSLNLETKQHQ